MYINRGIEYMNQMIINNTDTTKMQKENAKNYTHKKSQVPVIYVLL